MAELFELQANADFTSLLTASTPGLRESHLKRALPTISAEELKVALTGQGYVENSDFQVDVDADTLKRGLEVAEQEKPSLPNEPMEEPVSSQQETGDRRELDDSVNNTFDETQLKVRPRPSVKFQYWSKLCARVENQPTTVSTKVIMGEVLEDRFLLSLNSLRVIKWLSELIGGAAASSSALSGSKNRRGESLAFFMCAREIRRFRNSPDSQGMARKRWDWARV